MSSAAYTRHLDDDDESSRSIPASFSALMASEHGGDHGDRPVRKVKHPARGGRNGDYRRNERDNTQQVDPDSPLSPISSSPPLTLRSAPAYIQYHASSIFSRFRAYLMELWIGQKLAVQYLMADTKRHKKGVAIGIFTVFLVVMLIV